MNPVFLAREADRKRFWAFVERAEGGCWTWRGAKKPDGRGRFLLRGKNVIASRVAWAIANGREPDKLVCHSCDNPSCVNPAHLWLGSNQENCLDASSKGRLGRTHCQRGHELTPENTLRRSRGAKVCLTCRRGGTRKHYAPKPVCKNGHARTPENVTDRKECRICRRERDRAAKRAKREAAE